MPSNKEKVASYLEDDEATALKELCKENGYTNSEGVKHLIRNYLIENDSVDQVDHEIQMLNERIQKLEKTLDEAVSLMFRSERWTGESRDVIGKLEEELKQLQSIVRGEYSNELSDEQIAAITGQSVWKVKLWRYGIQKPRGKRIKQNLEPYIVDEGKWKKRSE